MSMYHKELPSPATIEIPGGLKEGHQIIVWGEVSTTDQRFSINIQKSQAANTDIALHFNPRNDEKLVVRNSFQNGWQTEERSKPSFPFLHGQQFKVHIYVTQAHYCVFVNDIHYIDYNHRLDFHQMEYLKLSPGAEYHEVFIKEKCRIPCHMNLPELHEGSAVRVRGLVRSDAKRFAVNFNCDENEERIGFHFNPRQDENDTVLNTFKNGAWGPEQRGFSFFPFGLGKYFDIFFTVHDGHFIVTVNNQHLTDYAFRVPLTDIRFLHVFGDICLMEVIVCDELMNEYVKPIHGGLQIDDMVAVYGFFKQGVDRFQVNLLTGTSENSQRALHINPRRGQNEVVLNSTASNAWQTEIKYPLPAYLQEKTPFLVCIVNKADHFDVYLGNEKLGEFPNRVPASSIQAIYCKEDAYFHGIEVLPKLRNPDSMVIPGGASYDSWLSVFGIPKENAVRFAIESKNGPDTQETVTNNIALHYNPRFNESTTVRNTLNNGSWGAEERNEAAFPFHPGQIFEVTWLMTEQNYHVIANGMNHTKYKHRLPALSVSHINTRLDADFYIKEFS